MIWLGGLPAGYFRAFFSCFGKADGNGLLAAGDGSPLAAFARFQCAVLSPAHRAFNGLAGCLAILSSTRFLGRTFRSCHLFVSR